MRLPPTATFGWSNRMGTVMTISDFELATTAEKWTPSPPVDPKTNAPGGVASCPPALGCPDGSRNSPIGSKTYRGSSALTRAAFSATDQRRLQSGKTRFRASSISQLSQTQMTMGL